MAIVQFSFSSLYSLYAASATLIHFVDRKSVRSNRKRGFKSLRNGGTESVSLYALQVLEQRNSLLAQLDKRKAEAATLAEEIVAIGDEHNGVSLFSEQGLHDPF